MSRAFRTSTMNSEPVLPIVWGGMSLSGRSVIGTGGMLVPWAGAVWAETLPVAAKPIAGAAAIPARNCRRLIFFDMDGCLRLRRASAGREARNCAEFAIRAGQFQAGHAELGAGASGGPNRHLASAAGETACVVFLNNCRGTND